jgi:hypothetical protein
LRDAEADPRRKWVLLETWGLSTLFHLSMLLALGLSWKAVAKPAGDEPELLRTVELVQRRNTPEGPVLVDQATSEAEAATASPGPVDVGQLLGGAAPPLDLTSALPKAGEVAGLGLPTGNPMLGGGGLLQGPGAKTVPTAGRGRTSVYGLSGEGFKFVYIFDRSGSMSGSGGKPLAAAKRELLRSLADLGPTHQFQIIFYNEDPTVMRIGSAANLMFADDANKQAAERYVKSITADGATEHESALLAGLQLKPDVIFFLTDADQPGLSPAQLERITRLNDGRAVINTIEFGLGPKIRKHNFLDAVAEQNGGGSAYIDISQ